MARLKYTLEVFRKPTMSTDSGAGAQRVEFATTHWTQILATQGEAPESRQALSDLCAAYYVPVVRALQSERRTEDQARELAHAFFERILAQRGFEGADPERGRFRSYLLGALKHFVANARVREARQKRGGGWERVPIDTPANGTPSEACAEVWVEPDAASFDRSWALQVLERAFARLSRDAAAAGTNREYEVMKRWLTGDGDASSQATAAADLGMSDGAFRVALHRLRRRFRENVKTEIASTVASVEDVADELRYLIAAL